MSTTLWTDRDQDFAVRRIVVANGKRVLVQYDIDYAKDAKYGWIPSHWKTTVNGSDGKAKTTVEGSVKSYKINPVIPIAEFRVKFPLGTWVDDENAKESYIVRPNGGKRLILSSESKASYQQLLDSESGKIPLHAPTK